MPTERATHSQAGVERRAAAALGIRPRGAETLRWRTLRDAQDAEHAGLVAVERAAEHKVFAE